MLITSVLPKDTEVQQCVNNVNIKIRNLVDTLLQEEKKVVLVDLDADKPVETGEDGLPTEEGYKTIAQLLYDGIKDVSERCWFEASEGVAEASEDVNSEGIFVEDGEPILTNNEKEREAFKKFLKL